MIDTFIFRREWLDNIKSLPIEQQDKIVAEIVRYGVDLEPQHMDDPVIGAFVNMVKGSISFSKDKYEQKVLNGKTVGRKKKVDNQEIYNLAREGKSANEIAEIIGCSKSSIDHSEGWRQRDKAEFSF